MTISFSDPDEKPFGGLSNHAIGHFMLDGEQWRSIEHYFQAQKFAGSPYADEIRNTLSPQDTVQRAALYQDACRPDWEDVQDLVMWKALLYKFQCIEFRPILLKTGDEAIVANIPDPYWGSGPQGNGENRLGQLLMKIREIVRQRAEDSQARQCPHEEVAETGHVCLHFLENRYIQDYYRFFTGHGTEFVLACSNCTHLPPEELAKNLRPVCHDCFENMASSGYTGKIMGLPEFPQKDIGLFITHEERDLTPVLPPASLGDIQPIPGSAENLWIAVTAERQLWRLDSEHNTGDYLCELPPEAVNFSEKISLHLSPAAHFAAVVNTRGQYGVVIDLATGTRTMQLDRGNYHVGHSDFPVAFFEAEGKTWLVHATDWNRLDISDPHTGEVATWRISPVSDEKNPRPDHYLDYFHCGLRISPDYSWIADNGWVWSPVGQVRVWSLPRWLEENVWESEDGPTNKGLRSSWYYWDGPLCWVDDHTLAVWGEGEDDALMIPAAHIFDAVSGEEVRRFAGPVGEFVFDRYLFSFDAEHGLAAWDIKTGERLFHASDFCPTHYHRGAKTFLTLLPEGKFRLSRLKEKES